MNFSVYYCNKNTIPYHTIHLSYMLVWFINRHIPYFSDCLLYFSAVLFVLILKSCPECSRKSHLLAGVGRGTNCQSVLWNVGVINTSRMQCHSSCFSLWKSGFSLRLVQVGFVLDRVALGQVSPILCIMCHLRMIQ
jgi:hypothetical protein